MWNSMQPFKQSTESLQHQHPIPEAPASIVLDFLPDGSNNIADDALWLHSRNKSSPHAYK